MVRFSVSQDGIWAMNKAIESHNHKLIRPDEKHLLRPSRSISDENASVLKSMSEVWIRTIDAFTYLFDEVGGVGNLWFTKRDAYNYIQKERRAKIETRDTNSLIKLFKEWTIDDNMFVWVVQTDEDDCLLNFFWLCDSVEEFERKWTESISEGNLQSHQWLNDLNKIREKWSTAFNKDCFNIGILSTQRSESTNHVCHGYSKPTSTINECFLGLENVMRT
ncbi:Protein FAR1-RELATED SEQUENCE 5 [Dendrobium catenatum]|uniref:Protein FAR1-RELATED SEQUENCE 5 n=1 Tax=Dendrobium catenatum TaxID=906689 RepID=A0A2I0X6Q8_9ASPA|nr:Protein FAR1-RELATED SEQUENCE 5 [Dendrobium catenatum]